MNGTDKQNWENGQMQDSDALAELFRHTATRERAPIEDEQRIRDAVHAQWQELTRRRRSRKIVWAGAIAASVMLTTLIGIRVISVPAPAGFEGPIAVADKLIGTAMTRSVAGAMAVLELSTQDLLIGQAVQTGVESKLALHWNNGVLIRMDELSELELLSSEEVALVSGRIYLDTASYTASATSGAPLIVRTPQGQVRHIGTQFMTSVSSNGTSVSVREGEVMYLPLVGGSDGNSSAETTAGVGQQIEVTADGVIRIEAVPTWGPDWAWTETLSPGFQSDGRSLTELLSWVGRESGRQVRYLSTNAEAVAAATVLHGNLNVQPLQALAVATATSDLVAEVEYGMILVSLTQ